MAEPSVVEPLKPPLVLHHIPKTAGTSLRRVARANYAPPTVVNLDRQVAGGVGSGDFSEPRWAEVVQRFRDYHASLPPAEAARIQCFLGHSAPFLIATAQDRPLRAFCVLRDPVERVLSQYRFHQLWEPRLPQPVVGLNEAMRRLGMTTLADIYRRLGGVDEARSDLEGRFWLFFNGQTRHLLMGSVEPETMPFAANGSDLDRYGQHALDLLSDVYVVGTQERFSESVRLFADTFGWERVFLPRERVSGAGRTRNQVDEETCTLIRAHNQLDAQLHAHYSQKLEGLPKVDRLGNVHWKLRRRTTRGVRKVLGRGR